MPAKKSEGKPRTPDEGSAISAIGKALGAIDDPAARNRVLQWAVSAYGTGGLTVGSQTAQDGGRRQSGGGARSGVAELPPPTSLGDLVEQANPQDQTDRVLVVGYWLQSQTPDGFVSQAVNDALKNMGHPILNITDKLTKMINKRPALIRQVGKSGKTKQARKTYRLTDVGKRRVEALLRGEGAAVEDEE